MNTADSRALSTRAGATDLARVLIAVGGLALALAVAAQIRIPLPFTPVPITLQTFVLYLGAAWIGPRLAAAGIGLYVGLALLGLPVMSGLRGGFGAFAGATGGYILGWFLAVLLLGRILDGRRHGMPFNMAAMAGASALILFCGALHLGLLLDLSPAQAFLMGVAPFLPGDTLKILSAAALVRRWPNPTSMR